MRMVGVNSLSERTRSAVGSWMEKLRVVAASQGLRLRSRRSETWLAKCPPVTPTKAWRSDRCSGFIQCASGRGGLPGGARALPHHVAAQPGLGNAVGVRGERTQLIELEARVGHPVVKALHELAARDHRQLIQGRTGVCAPGHQLLVQALMPRG